MFKKILINNLSAVHNYYLHNNMRCIIVGRTYNFLIFFNFCKLKTKRMLLRKHLLLIL